MIELYCLLIVSLIIHAFNMVTPRLAESLMDYFPFLTAEDLVSMTPLHIWFVWFMRHRRAWVNDIFIREWD